MDALLVVVERCCVAIKWRPCGHVAVWPVAVWLCGLRLCGHVAVWPVAVWSYGCVAEWPEAVWSCGCVACGRVVVWLCGLPHLWSSCRVAAMSVLTVNR